jgi:hypothetical protein
VSERADAPASWPWASDFKRLWISRVSGELGVSSRLEGR